MRFRPFIVAVLALVALTSRPVPVAAAGVANIDQPVLDVGAVRRGDVIRKVFEIVNVGTGPLTITEVKPTCGCTVVDYDRVIEPGESGRLTAVVSTKNFRGPIAKSIQVFTSDPENPRLNLVVKADVRTIVGVDPGYARWVTVFGEETEASEQLIWSETGTDFEIESIDSPYQFISVGIRQATPDERKEGRKGHQWVAQISLERHAPPGALAGYITLHTTDGNEKEVRIPVSGFVRPVVTVLPRVADFGRKSLADEPSATLEVKNLGTEEIELGEIATDLKGVETTLESVEDGKRFKLKVRLTPGMPKGAFQGTVTIQTTSRLQPVIEVGVRGTIL